MTQSTEQERADFLAWIRTHENERGAVDEASAWAAWSARGLEQATRRAPVVPVNEAIRDLMHLIDDWSEKDFVAAEARLIPWSENDPSAPMQMLEKLDGDAYAARLAIEQKLRTLLAAAPQPPEGLMRENPATRTEAAPVQLPECGIDTANHAGVRVRGYTEQQVRQLLAAQEHST